jgi:hypothetical protein
MYRFTLLLTMIFLIAACSSPKPNDSPPQALNPAPAITSVPGPAPDEATPSDDSANPAGPAEPMDQPVEAVAPPPPATEAGVPADAPLTPTPAPVAAAPVPTMTTEPVINPYGMVPATGQVAVINPYELPRQSTAATNDARAVAQPFVEAVLRRDLGAAREYFSPSLRPESWANLIPAEGIDGTPSDFSECRGATPEVSDVAESDTRQSIIFRFPTECAKVPVLSGPADQSVQRFGGMGVRVERINSRWQVTGLALFRARA